MDWSHKSDYELMDAIASSDDAALRCLINRYSPVVIAICRRMLGNPTEAEDAAAEIFVELWTKRMRFEASRGKPRSYILLLARSRCLDRLRKVAHPLDSTHSHPYLDSMAASAELPPHEHIELSDLSMIIRRLLQDLSAPQHETIELAFFEDLTHREIAKRLDMPLGTVKTHIRNGLAKLRFLLKSSWEEGN